MCADVWDKPTPPTGPPVDAAEGLPAPSGFDIVEVFANNADIREGKQILGCFYEVGGVKQTIAAIEGGRFDLARRELYRAFKRLQNLNFLMGLNVFAWSTGFAHEAATGGNFAEIYEYDASGSGTTITITWTGGHSDPPQSIGLYPGAGIIIDRDGLFGMAQIVDFEFLSTTSASITLSKELNANINSKAWIIIEVFLEGYPAVHLNTADEFPGQCKNAIRSPWGDSYFASYKARFTSSPFNDGIVPPWFCAKLTDPASLIETFEAGHVNTECPNYEPNREPTYWEPEDFGFFDLGRGTYLIQATPGVATLRIGREGASGIFQIIGWPVGQFADNLWLSNRKTYYGNVQAMEYKTGDLTDDEYAEFLNFLDHQQKLRDAASPESDNVGITGEIDNLAVHDPMGGTGPGAMELVNDDARTPGYIAWAALGRRRGQIASMGATGQPSGPGGDMAQTVRKRRYTSARFTLPRAAAGGILTTSNGEVSLEFFDSPQSLEDSFQYNIEMTVPRLCEIVDDPDTRQTKSVPGEPIFVATSTGDQGEIEFELGERTAYWPSGGMSVGESVFDCGGNAVLSQISREIFNPHPGSGGSVGSRQEKIGPGDQISFDAEAVADIFVTVVAAEAYGGSVDGAADAPHAAATHIPQYVRDNHAKRDLVTIDLSGESGQIIKTWIDDGDADGVSLAQVRHGAILPPREAYTGASTSYLPTVYRVANGSAKTLLSSAHYRWDNETGRLYLNTNLPSAWSTSDTLNIFFQAWVYDARRIYPCEDPESLNKLIDDACDNGFIPIPLGGSGQIEMQLYSQTLEDVIALPYIRVWPPGAFLYDDPPFEDLVGMNDYANPSTLIIFANLREFNGVSDWEARWSTPVAVPNPYIVGIARGVFPPE